MKSLFLHAESTPEMMQAGAPQKSTNLDRTTSKAGRSSLLAAIEEVTAWRLRHHSVGLSKTMPPWWALLWSHDGIYFMPLRRIST